MFWTHYLENGWRYRLDYNGAPIGNGTCGIKWSCDDVTILSHYMLFPIGGPLEPSLYIRPLSKYYIQTLRSCLTRDNVGKICHI